MKKLTKNNYSGKNSKQFRKKSDSNFNSKENNSSKKNNRLLTNYSKSESVQNLNESDKIKLRSSHDSSQHIDKTTKNKQTNKPNTGLPNIS